MGLCVTFHDSIKNRWINNKLNGRRLEDLHAPASSSSSLTQKTSLFPAPMHYSYIFGMRVRLESGVMMGNAYGPSGITMGSGNQAYFLLGRTHLIISSQSIDFDVRCVKVHVNMEAVHMRATQIFSPVGLYYRNFLTCKWSASRLSSV